MRTTAPDEADMRVSKRWTDEMESAASPPRKHVRFALPSIAEAAPSDDTLAIANLDEDASSDSPSDTPAASAAVEPDLEGPTTV